MTNAPKKVGPWLVHDTQTAFESPWMRIETSPVTLPSGAPGRYGVVRFKFLATGVLPIDEEGFTWLVGQHRFPHDEYSWELPEGGGEKGVDPRISAARELKEETGFSARHWAPVGQWRLSNSITDEVGYGYVAWGLEAGESAPDETEVLSVARVPVSELVERCVSGDIVDSFTHLIVFGALEKARRGLLPPDVARLLVN